MKKRSLLLSVLILSFFALMSCAEAAQAAENHQDAVTSKKVKLITEIVGGRAYDKIWVGDVYNVRMLTRVDGSIKFDFSNLLGGLAADDLANTEMQVYYYAHNLPRTPTDDKDGDVPSRNYLNAITIDKDAKINFYGEGVFYPIVEDTAATTLSKNNDNAKNPYVFELSSIEASEWFPKADKYQAMTIEINVGDYIYYLKSEADGDGRIEVVGVLHKSRFYVGDIITSDNYIPSGRISYGR